jgi:hypothetical protein
MKGAELLACALKDAAGVDACASWPPRSTSLTCLCTRTCLHRGCRVGALMLADALAAAPALQLALLDLAYNQISAEVASHPPSLPHSLSRSLAPSRPASLPASPPSPSLAPSLSLLPSFLPPSLALSPPLYLSRSLSQQR